MDAKWISRALNDRHGDRLRKLAGSIDRLVEQDDKELRRIAEVGKIRIDAAMELHKLCVEFVASVNQMLEKTQLEMSPAAYAVESFREDSPNIFQISVRGRLLQIQFETPDVLVSTENFRAPYVLEGAVRFFNQERLDRNAIEEHQIYHCLEPGGPRWRYFNTRTYHTGLVDVNYLASLLEQLV